MLTSLPRPGQRLYSLLKTAPKPHYKSRNINKMWTNQVMTTSGNQTNDIEWEVYYWPFKNRGNHLVLLLEETNASYKLINDPKEVVQYIRSTAPFIKNQGFKQLEPDDKTIFYQPMAPPYLIHHNQTSNQQFMLSQTVHCVGYIAEKVGLKPKLIEDNYRAQMIVANTNDLQTELRSLRLTAKSKQEALEFINGRFEVWMDILEKPLTIYQGQKFYFDDKISQADLCVFNIINGIHELFGEERFNIIIKSKHPVLVNHYERILNKPRVKQLMEKQEKQNMRWFPIEPVFGVAWDWTFIHEAIDDLYKLSKL